jgi:hypothetical protein
MMTSGKTSILTLRFDPPRSGWLGITVLFGRQKIPINTSSVFDPFPDFLIWLEKLAAGELPCAWRINEEDSFMLFIVQPAERGKGRLVLRGTRERNGAPDDTQDITQLPNIDTPPIRRNWALFSGAGASKKGFISLGATIYVDGLRGRCAAGVRCKRNISKRRC